MDWKQQLYSTYVSGGQAAPLPAGEVRAQAYPHTLALIRQHFPADRQARVLDLGCGHGTLLACARHLGYQNLTGVDGSAEQVALAHRLGRPDVRCQDIFDFVAQAHEVFDVVCLMDVLEHLTRPELLRFMSDLPRIMAPGARLLVHVPNAEGLHGMRIRYGDLTHEIAFTAQSMHQLLTACGFDQIACREDRPAVHGLKSAVRALLWQALTVVPRLQLLAETGSGGHLLSQNMLVTARRAGI